jgi:L,D-transpeptidase ErfK/SrfK
VETLIFALVLSTIPPAAVPNVTAPRVVGAVAIHEVGDGDTLTRIGARRGVDVSTLARENGLGVRDRLEAGTQLLVPAVHLAPQRLPDGVVVNLPQRMLYLWEGGNLAGSWPVAVGGPRWKTPRGSYRVMEMEEDPTWDVPVSIQAEMRRKGQRVRTKVLPGPGNPLGARWVGLTVGNIGIHGTNAPSSIYKFATHGCVRMHPDDVAELFTRLTVDTPVELVYEPALLTVHAGRVLVEVHPDPYGLAPDAALRLRAQAEALGVAERVDWALVGEAVKMREGVARVIGSAQGPDRVD